MARPKSEGLGRERFYQLYVIDGLSAREVGQALGMSESNVRHWLRRYEIPSRTRSEALGGKRNPAWRGGTKRTEKGYVLVKCPDSPMAFVNGYVPEHRLVMSEHVGRPLRSDEHVHHKNGVKDDNRIENLELMTQSEHLSFEAIVRNRKRSGRGQECSSEGCLAPVKCRHLCSKHYYRDYAQRRKRGDVDTRYSRSEPRPCADEEGCGRIAEKRGLCSKHYQRKRWREKHNISGVN